MKKIIKLGIIGDYNSTYQSHIATQNAIKHIEEKLMLKINITWLPTITIEKDFDDETFKQYNCFWCAPGSLKSIDGALKVIKYSRINNIPYIGTCGGFHHTIIEYARNVLNMSNASHEEVSPNLDLLLISKLSCSLFGTKGRINIIPNTMAHSVYKRRIIEEEFRCNYGLNPIYIKEFNNKELIFSGFGSEGEPRILELLNHRFFTATLFLPQLSSSRFDPHPLIKKFIQVAESS